MFPSDPITGNIYTVNGVRYKFDGRGFVLALAVEPAFTKLTAFNKNFGTLADTVAEGNDSRINNGQTAFGWGNHTLAGYALDSALTAHINRVDNPHSVTKAQVGLGNVDNTSDAGKPISTATQTALDLKLNKSIFDDLFEKVEVSTGVYAIKAKYDFYSTGEVSAYGLGVSGGGGGGSMVVWGTESAGAVPLTVEGITKTLSLASHTHSGYLTSETDPTVPSFVKAITQTQVTNWDSYGTSIHSHLNKSTLDAITAAYTTAEKTKLSGIAAGAEVNVNADWNATTGDAQILNKPTSMPASDVHAWAKAATKPTYVWSEIGNKPTTFAPSAHTHYKSDIIDFAHTHNLSEIGITGLSTNYLTKYNGSTLVNSSIYDSNGNIILGGTSFANYHTPSKLNILGGLWVGDYNAPQTLSLEGDIKLKIFDSTIGGIKANNADGSNGGITLQYVNAYSLQDGLTLNYQGNVGIGTTTPTATLDVNGIGKFKDDLLMTFNTWTHATDKNSLNKFLKLFDIDEAGNLVVKTNLYSTGEVTAYSSGTGVSGLKLMGNLDANGKNIFGANSIIFGDTVDRTAILGTNPFDNSGSEDRYGLWTEYGNTSSIATYDNTTGKFHYGGDKMSVDWDGLVTAPAFKFGSWTFRQDASGRLGIYNGTTEVACFNTDGTYVNL